MKRCLQCNSTFNDGSWTCPSCEFEPVIQKGYMVFAPELSQTNDTYETEFFANLAQLEKGHFWFEARNQLLQWAINKYFPNIKKLLEIGCGTGFVLHQFASCLNNVDLYGSDLLVDGLDFAAKRVPSATLCQMDARAIPYQEEFDVIGVFDVIEHIEEDELALSQIYNALKPGGGIILTIPQHRFLWSVVDDLSYHKRRYTRDDLVSKVRRAGFQVVKTTSFVSLLLPLMLLNRMRKSSREDEFDLFAEFKISPLLNVFLSQIMRIEVTLIRQGIPFRLGGSRLLVAKRPELSEVRYV